MKGKHPAYNASYKINVRPLTDAEGGGWLAEILDLPGCIGDGETPEEAIKDLEEAKIAWIEAQIDAGRDIPMPRLEPEYSGRITLRLPKSLHRRLANQAEIENISLNQYILSLVSENHAKHIMNPMATGYYQSREPITESFNYQSKSRFNYMYNRENPCYSLPSVEILTLELKQIVLEEENVSR